MASIVLISVYDRNAYGQRLMSAKTDIGVMSDFPSESDGLGFGSD